MKYVQPLNETANSGYSNGNSQNGTPGSIIPAQAIEHPMREIVNVISESGLTPDADDNTQLWQALRRALQPTGLIEIWSGELSEIPDGWLYCQGQAVSRTTYADLFALVGTKYGNGNGSTTFNVPNMTQRTVMGRRYSTTDWGVGDTGGSFTKTVNTAASTVDVSGATDGHALTTNEMPSHTHNWDPTGHVAGNDSGQTGITSGAVSSQIITPFDVSSTGGDQAHSHNVNIIGTGSHNHSLTVDTTPPYIAMIYIIRT
ncbi:MAG: phage tail protein [Alphaproteobacteria bacterium]|nr:phage tail protein [Alphaproteobacteria bacterium]